jgi:hypothetical protein
MENVYPLGAGEHPSGAEWMVSHSLFEGPQVLSGHGFGSVTRRLHRLAETFQYSSHNGNLYAPACVFITKEFFSGISSGLFCR